MALAYTQVVDKRSCVGNTLSTMNMNITALDAALSALSAATITRINYLSASINALSSNVNFLSSNIVTLNTTVQSNSACWTSACNDFTFRSALTTVSTNLYELGPASFNFISCSAESLTALLPLAVNYYSKQFTVKKIDNTTNILHLSSTPSNTIDGLTSRDLPNPNDAVTFISDGSVWWII